MRRLFSLLMLGSLVAACTSGGKAYIPVDSPLRTWTAPESDAYAPEPVKTAPPMAKESPKEPVKETVKEAPVAPKSPATPKEKKAEKRP